jgi:hypothetical protein
MLFGRGFGRIEADKSGSRNKHKKSGFCPPQIRAFSALKKHMNGGNGARVQYPGKPVPKQGF